MLDARELKRQILTQIDMYTEWPSYMKEYHKNKLRIITETSKNFEDILCNVNKPTLHTHECVCQGIQAQRVLDKLQPLATVKGHIFTIGREYKGPHESVLKVAAGNVPCQTLWDLRRAWNRETTKIDFMTQGKKKCEGILNKCIKQNTHKPIFPSTRDAYQLKKKLNGLIIGTLDKNKGELSLVCPTLYYEALVKMYNDEAGYRRVHIAKLSTYRKQRYSNAQLPEQIIRETGLPRNQRGTQKDIVKMWERIYKEKGWRRYAQYNTHGGFNQPYILFKAKNVTDPDVREHKWQKARPIAPGVSHPMKRLLSLAGRAWSFVTANMTGENFIINHGGKVPAFLEEANKLRQYGEIKYVIKDIEGCFPNMPKPIIRHAMRKIVHDIEKKHGYEGVAIPTYKKSAPCTWRRSEKMSYTWMPFETMVDIMDFALDNAYVKMQDGTIRKQMQGIPMGDPLSPGMTIGTCAWMEQEWLSNLSDTDKLMFKAKRYMDDILMVYATPDWWDHERFLNDFTKSEIYCKPLKLTEGDDDTFLETSLKLEEGAFSYWLKNKNTDETKIWRYQHYDSYSPVAQKKALVKACLRKVNDMASNDRVMMESAKHKLQEFRRLEYPVAVLKQICNYIATTTGNRRWIHIRNGLTY